MNGGTVNLVSGSDIRLNGAINTATAPGATSDGNGGIPLAGAFFAAEVCRCLRPI